MTGLHRTPLTTSQKIECVAKALAGQEACGGIAGLSRSSGVSRPTVYAAKGAALEVLREHFEEPESDPTVWVKIDPAQVRRTVVALRVMAPNALRLIEDMIPIIYPGVRLSYGKVQSRAAEAEAQAAAFNAKADLAGVRAGALDERFSQGEPVLAGVDLDSGYLFGLALRETRSGKDWAEVLKQGQEQGLNLAVVVKDAAKGIESGVRDLFPQAEQRDDCSMPFMSSIRCGDGSSNGLTVPLPPKKKPVISCRRSPPATVNNGGATATESLVPTATAKRLLSGLTALRRPCRRCRRGWNVLTWRMAIFARPAR